MKYLNNWILYIKISYISLKIKCPDYWNLTVQCTSNEMDNHIKNICININNLLQFFLTPLTLNYSDIAKQSNM